MNEQLINHFFLFSKNFGGLNLGALSSPKLNSTDIFALNEYGAGKQAIKKHYVIALYLYKEIVIEIVSTDYFTTFKYSMCELLHLLLGEVKY